MSLRPRPVDNPSGSWTIAVRSRLEKHLPYAHLLPDRQPAYVGSWVYVFGVVTLAALIWVVISGAVLAFMGPQWWHMSATGRFFNSMHFWSTQVFFVFMVLHLWGQFFMQSWRHGRAPTWMVGSVIFAVSIVTAFTGYLAQQNFDSQWIAVNAKDAVNSTGVGSFFNVLNFGQMFGLHILMFPVLLITLVGIHLMQVRFRGVVKPIERRPEVR
ncbi:MAG: cytochrome b N-terminal domain-containing protein [Candidatus Dormibacterales bacterium]